MSEHDISRAVCLDSQSLVYPSAGVNFSDCHGHQLRCLRCELTSRSSLDDDETDCWATSWAGGREDPRRRRLLIGGNVGTLPQTGIILERHLRASSDEPASLR
jgi:hypothetical protein